MTFTPGMLTHLGTVHLLRAMAKVEVSCKTSGWTLEKVELLRYNATGYCAPSGVYSQDDYVKGKLRRRLHGHRASAGRQERRGPENTRIRPDGGRAFRRLRPRIPERRGRDREPQSGRRSRNAGPIQGGARQGVCRRIQILQRAARRQRRRRSVRHPAQLLLQILDFEDIRTGSRRRGVSYELVELDPGFGLLP